MNECVIFPYFFTALKVDKENHVKSLNIGAEAFLTKPIDETELNAQIISDKARIMTVLINLISKNPNKN
jgi:response regulator RpfG family c-di-GMP phosphodiesterase